MGRNFRWNLVGSIALAAQQWLQLVIVARMGGTAAAGAYAFALALAQPPMALASFNARTLLASDARREFRFVEYRRLRAVASGAAIAAILVIALVRDSGATGWGVIGAVCVMRAADLITDIYFGEWQRHERMRAIGITCCLQALGTIAFMSLAWVLRAGVVGAAVGAALGSLVALLAIHVCTAGDGELKKGLGSDREPVRWNRVGRLALQALPLSVIMLLAALQPNVPRYFIQHQGGDAALGIYAAANQLVSAGTIFVGSLSAAAVPRLAALCAGGDVAGFRTLTHKLVLVGALLGAAGVLVSLLVGREVLVLLYRSEFGSGAPMLVVLSMAAGAQFMASFLGFALTSARVIAVQPFLLAATLAVLVGCCALLVPTRGAQGAAWALVIASSLQVVASEVLLRRFRVSPTAPVRAAAAP
jgi:O-antigen/teichoic acid export membrane protein